MRSRYILMLGAFAVATWGGSYAAFSASNSAVCDDGVWELRLPHDNARLAWRPLVELDRALYEKRVIHPRDMKSDCTQPILETH